MKAKAKELLVHYFEVATGKEMPADRRAEIGEIIEAIVCAAADEVESRRASAREIVRRELEEARKRERALRDDLTAAIGHLAALVDLYRNGYPESDHAARLVSAAETYLESPSREQEVGAATAEIADRILALLRTPRGEGAGVVAAASAYLRALDTYRKECRDREIPLAEYVYDEFQRLAEPLAEAEERLRAALCSGSGTPPGEGATCYDCGRRYGDEFGFPDLIVPDDVWEQISPTGHEGGLLCPSCLVKRCVDHGIVCEAQWTSGPFATDARRLAALRSAPSGVEEGESEWEPMSMSMAGVAHSRLVPFRHRPSDVVAWVDQRAAARLRGEGGGE